VSLWPSLGACGLHHWGHCSALGDSLGSAVLHLGASGPTCFSVCVFVGSNVFSDYAFVYWGHRHGGGKAESKHVYIYIYIYIYIFILDSHKSIA